MGGHLQLVGLHEELAQQTGVALVGDEVDDVHPLLDDLLVLAVLSVARRLLRAAGEQPEAQQLPVGVALDVLLTLLLHGDVGDLVELLGCVWVLLGDHENPEVQEVQLDDDLVVVDHEVDEDEHEDLCDTSDLLEEVDHRRVDSDDLYCLIRELEIQDSIWSFFLALSTIFHTKK